jgi:intracellular sulfur oxidation DsrE/DsrF family protein
MKWFLIILGMGVGMGLANALHAEELLSEEKPFAQAHVILQVSQADTNRHSLTLDIANNLSKHYGGQDMVDIEIVAFGPGVPLLFAKDNPQRDRIKSLMEHGVRFFVCGNTLDTIERRTSSRPEIVNGVELVQTGVAFMIDEIQRGYVHVQP